MMVNCFQGITLFVLRLYTRCALCTLQSDVSDRPRWITDNFYQQEVKAVFSPANVLHTQSAALLDSVDLFKKPNESKAYGSVHGSVHGSAHGSVHGHCDCWN